MTNGYIILGDKGMFSTNVALRQPTLRQTSSPLYPGELLPLPSPVLLTRPVRYRPGTVMARLTRILSIRTTRVVALVLLILLCLINRHMPVDLKGAPTDFSSLPDLSNRSSSTQLPRQLVRQLQGSSGLDIDDRYIFVRELGSGCEGTVRLYRDTSTGRPVAIKVFQSKYRNPLPAHISEALEAESVKYWPAEIPATILLGESALGMNDSGLIADHEIEPSSVDVLPALDYFLIRGSTRLPPALVWHLVTPYLGKGTFIDLSKRLAADSRSFTDLDLSLRPKLHRLLGSLARMHRIGVVCKTW